MAALVSIALIWFMASAAASAAGVGVVMLSMPLATLILSPSDAVLVACLATAPWVVLQFLTFKNSINFKSILLLGLGSLPGCAIGTLLLKSAPPYILELAVSGMILLFLLLRLQPREVRPMPPSKAFDLAAGCVCGISAAAVGMDGPPLAITSLLKGWTPDESRGNMSAFFLFTTAGLIASQAAAGLYTADLVPFVLAGIAGIVPGQKVGVLLAKKTSPRAFGRLLLLFLLCAASSLLWRGISEVAALP